MNKHKAINITLYLIFILIISSIILYFNYNYRIFIVASGSMQPTLQMNEMVIIRKVKSNTKYTKGDIITYYDFNTDENITHRIAEVSKDGYYTKGDINNANDINIVNDEQIIGKMIYHSFFLGNLYIKYRYILLILIVTFFVLFQILRSFINKEKGGMDLNEKRI